jgi:16S rRNA (cytosine967-C5)-methyltransferase
VERTLAARAPADTFLAAAQSPFDGRDRRLLAELVFGTLRWLRRLDHVLARAGERAITAIDDELLAPMRIAALQILALERVPAHAAVSEAVDEARRRRGRGAAGFVNAVLRRIASAPRFEDWPVEIADPRHRLAIEESHPDVLVERWWARFGEERTRAVLRANNGARALHLLAFGERGGRDELARRLAVEGVETRSSALAPDGLVVTAGQPLTTDAFRRGEFYVQDEASQAAALLPPPRAGERVLDAAAAPGGKGLALRACEPGVLVVFADHSLARLGRLGENLRRLGGSAPRVVADAAASPFAPVFDRVLLDAPCTGTGTLRRHPELRWRFGLDELARLADESLRMLVAAASAAAPGGLLIHVTCSLEFEENESVVARALAELPEFQLASLAEFVPSASEVELTGIGVRIFPGAGHDGFSISALRRDG